MEEDIKKKILEKHYQKSKMGDYLNDNTMKYVLDAMEEYAGLNNEEEEVQGYFYCIRCEVQQTDLETNDEALCNICAESLEFHDYASEF